MGFQVDLGDFRGDLDLAERFATRIGVVFGGANHAGFLAGTRFTTDGGIEHGRHRAGDMHVDPIADFQVIEGFGLFGQLDRHLTVFGTGDGYHALVFIDGEDVGDHVVFNGGATDQNVLRLCRETGCSHKRGKGEGVGQGAQRFHRHSFRVMTDEKHRGEEHRCWRGIRGALGDFLLI
ncbi:hypothetical protein D3C77_251190 [compost metagenome]